MQLIVEIVLIFCSMVTQSDYSMTLLQTSLSSLKESNSLLETPRCSRLHSPPQARGRSHPANGASAIIFVFPQSATCHITKSYLNLLGPDWIEQLGLTYMPLVVV
uniref:Uncharacterized protein n=1 Tax=Schistocephalus solidus TaxID=70667 RepID=A0A0X3PJ06_SCHSO